MKLDNKELYKFLNDKEITHLYHANTTSTSITFIEQGGLLSRGAIESKGVHQTRQDSDEIDKRFNVWNDVFLDTTDLHTYFSQQNYYGPISFRINTDFPNIVDFEIWVTKDNPINWTDAMIDQDRYFSSVDELEEKWDLFQRQRKMITIRNNTEPILMDYIDKILIDSPKVKIGEMSLFTETVKGFKTAVGENISLKNKFRTRVCISCFCRDNYLNQVSIPNLKRLFLPSNHPKFIN